MSKTILDLISSELNFTEIREYVSNHTNDYINFIKEEIFIYITKWCKKNKIEIVFSDLQLEFKNRQDLIKEAMI